MRALVWLREGDRDAMGRAELVGELMTRALLEVRQLDFSSPEALSSDMAKPDKMRSS